MSQSTAAQLTAFSQCLERLYAPTEASRFGEHVLQVIGDLVPNVCAGFDEINHVTGEARIALSNQAVPGDPVTYTRRAAENIEREHPGVAFLRSGGAAGVLHLSRFVSARQFRQTKLFEENYKPFGITYEAAIIRSSRDFTVGLAFGRDRDFVDCEIQQLELIAPHILRAYANSLLFSELQSSKAVASEFSIDKLWKARFSPREAEVAKWMIEGKRDAEIAVILNSNPRTIQKHVQHILAKLNVSTRIAATAALAEMFVR